MQLMRLRMLPLVLIRLFRLPRLRYRIKLSRPLTLLTRLPHRLLHPFSRLRLQDLLHSRMPKTRLSYLSLKRLTRSRRRLMLCMPLNLPLESLCTIRLQSNAIFVNFRLKFDQKLKISRRQIKHAKSINLVPI